jgi:hypothetical protein
MTYTKRRNAARRNISKAMLRAVSLERNAARSDISDTRREQLLREARRLRRNDAAIKAMKARRDA